VGELLLLLFVLIFQLVVNSDVISGVLDIGELVSFLLFVDSLLDGEHVIFSLILHSFLVKLHTHFLVSDSLNVISFSLFGFDLQFFFVHLSFLCLHRKSLFRFENLSFGASFSVNCVVLSTSLQGFLIYGVLSISSDFLGVHSVIFFELNLKILEQTSGNNPDIHDLTSLKPDTPTT